MGQYVTSTHLDTYNLPPFLPWYSFSRFSKARPTSITSTTAIAFTFTMRGAHEGPDEISTVKCVHWSPEIMKWDVYRGRRVAVAPDAIRRDKVGGVLIQSCSLSLGRDCIVSLVFSYVSKHREILHTYTSGDANDN